VLFCNDVHIVLLTQLPNWPNPPVKSSYWLMLRGAGGSNEHPILTIRLEQTQTQRTEYCFRTVH